MRSANKERFLIQVVADEAFQFMGMGEAGMMERACFSPQTGESAEHAIKIVQDERVFHEIQAISKANSLPRGFMTRDRAFCRLSVRPQEQVCSALRLVWMCMV